MECRPPECSPALSGAGTQRFDVAVIGAGVAGLWCATELARRGVGVLLVDAKAAVDVRVSTTGIFVRRTLEDFDLPAACLGPPIRRAILYSPLGRALELECERDEFRIARMQPLLRALLERCLRMGVTYRPNTWYEGADLAGTDNVLRLCSRAHPLAPQRPACRLLVGADGGRSRVAKDLGLSRNREFIIGIEHVYERARTDPASMHAGALHCFLDPALAPGYIAWIATDGAQTHVGTGGYAGRFAPHDALARFATKRGGIVDLERATLVERRAGEIPVNGILPRIAGPRGLLVGDAAGAVSPLTAGGLDGCVRLSQHAAEVIVASLARRGGATLEDYDGQRFASSFFARRWMRAALRVSPAWALELACAALRTTALLPFAQYVFFGRGSLPEPLAPSSPPLQSAHVAHRPTG